MATSSYYSKGSDEYIDAKCSQCADSNKDQTADHYCYDCQKHLCKECLDNHNSWIENHTVVEGNGEEKGELTEKFEEHKDELITLYCLRHNKLLCIQCRRMDHRTCKDVKHIKETARLLNADKDLQTVPVQLQSVLDNIQKAIKELENDIAYIQHNGRGFMKDLEIYAEKLLSRIKEMREKDKNALTSKHDQLVADAVRYRQAFVSVRDDVSRCLDEIKNTNQMKPILFILQKKSLIITKRVNVLYNDLNTWKEGRQFNFMADLNIIDSLNCFSSLLKEVSTKVADISSVDAVGGRLGRPGDRQVGRSSEKRGNSLEEKAWVKRGERPVESPDQTQVKEPEQTSRVKRGESSRETCRTKGEKNSGNGEPIRSKHISMATVRITEDRKRCYIYGCCRVIDGSLVLADKNNTKVKLVDTSNGTVTKYCDTDASPWDVCWLGPQEFAVAFCSPEILVYSAINLTQTRTIKLNHNTTTMACHGGLLYCDGWTDNSMYVHDVSSGRKLREIRPKNADGLSIFSVITGIAVNCHGDRVYVADSNNGLVCVSTDGLLMFRLSQAELGLSSASGVTTDHLGHVFVCGLYSHNVVKVTGDGHVVGQILSKEVRIECPWCLSYDVNRSKLYIGGQSDQLLMVELKQN